jgi:uncharacterized protein with ParB-like and HNH nuclease domain
MNDKNYEYISRSASQLIREIKDGKVKVPIFQRLYKWTSRNICELLESINNGYPIGSIFIWNYSGNEDYRADHSIINHITNKTEGSESPTPSYIVDGQQRLTTLYLIEHLHDLNEKLFDDRNNPSESKMLSDAVNTLKKVCISADCSGKDKKVTISFKLLSNSSKAFDDENTFFSAKLVEITKIIGGSDKVRKFRETFKGFFRENWSANYVSNEANDITEDLYHEIKNLFSRLRGAEIGVVNVSLQDINEMTEIYERLNQGGKKLNAYDIQKAKWSRTGLRDIDSEFNDLKTNVKDSCHINDIEKLDNEFISKSLLFSFKPDYIEKEPKKFDELKDYFNSDFKKIMSIVLVNLHKIYINRVENLRSYTLIAYSCVLVKQWYNEELKPKGLDFDKAKTKVLPQDILKKIKEYYVYSLLEERSSKSTWKNLLEDYNKISLNKSHFRDKILSRIKDFTSGEQSSIETHISDFRDGSRSSLLQLVMDFTGSTSYFLHTDGSRIAHDSQLSKDKKEKHHLFPLKQNDYKGLYAKFEEIGWGDKHPLITVHTSNGINNLIGNRKVSDYMLDQDLNDKNIMRNFEQNLLPIKSFQALLDKDRNNSLKDDEVISFFIERFKIIMEKVKEYIGN